MKELLLVLLILNVAASFAAIAIAADTPYAGGASIGYNGGC